MVTIFPAEVSSAPHDKEDFPWILKPVNTLKHKNEKQIRK